MRQLRKPPGPRVRRLADPIEGKKKAGLRGDPPFGVISRAEAWLLVERSVLRVLVCISIARAASLLNPKSLPLHHLAKNRRIRSD
jgi:hypothetical protein